MGDGNDLLKANHYDMGRPCSKDRLRAARPGRAGLMSSRKRTDGATREPGHVLDVTLPSTSRSIFLIRITCHVDLRDCHAGAKKPAGLTNYVALLSALC